MKAAKIIKFFVFITIPIITQEAWAQNPGNRTSKQLVEPLEPAQILKSGKDLPAIISVGPGAPLPYSIETGMAKEKDNLDTLKNKLSVMPKDTKIVIHCVAALLNIARM